MVQVGGRHLWVSFLCRICLIGVAPHCYQVKKFFHPKQKTSWIHINNYGRKQKLGIKELVMYDYIGCFYSEGYINPKYTFVFNHEDIEEIIFVGFIDEEEEAFVGLLNWIGSRNR